MKNKCLVIGFVFSFVFIFFSIIHLKSSKNLDDIFIEEKTISKSTEKYEIDIKYPVFESQKISDDIDKFINQQNNEFLDNIEDMELYEGIPMKYQLLIHSDWNHSKNKYLSIKFNISQYTGGAHPLHFAITKNYKYKTGNILELKDVFLNDNYLNKLSQLSREKLNKKEELEDVEKGWIEGGTEPDLINFESFILKDDSIIIFFSPYHIAPYVYGEQNVEIFYVELAD